MTLSRYPGANNGRSNTLTVDPATAWYLRFHYRNLRKAGASAFDARTALYDLVFQGSVAGAAAFQFNPAS